MSEYQKQFKWHKESSADKASRKKLAQKNSARVITFTLTGGEKPEIPMSPKEKKMKIFGVVGRNGGYVSKYGHLVLKIPSNDDKLVTPISESYQSLIWHSIVSHPDLQIHKTKW